ncbi:MAG TPA: hypothetical protein VHJ82_10910 [Actinomycetota bacterium]|nr:hypothetical protein [Actinomycetota bacterium]
MIEAARWLALLAGILVVVGTAGSVVRFLVVPRGLTARVPIVVARTVRKFFYALAKRADTYEVKDRVLAIFPPIVLLSQLVAFLTLFLVGYALILIRVADLHIGQALLESGSSIFTLGFAGTHVASATAVHFAAAATGLILIALQIGYLPTLYAAFNRRETLVTMLQSRAGAPAWGPEILARHMIGNMLDGLRGLYADWERWAADVAESHTNYPALIFFRSPHPLRSWVIALLAVMDSAAICLAVTPSIAGTQARLCLRMGFLCLRNIADFLRIPYDPDPFPDDPIALTFEEFRAGLHRMEELEFPFERSPEEAWPHFKGWRVNYEALAYTIADLVVAPPGPWSGPRRHLPDLEIIPQRPPDRRPGDHKEEVPKGLVGH